MATYSYRGLTAWQKAMDLAEAAYKVTKKLPLEERYALSDQIRRSAVSVPSNIAEGQKRLGKAETIHFTGIAMGSLAELQTQLELCRRLYSLPVDKELDQANEVERILSGLLRSLRS